MITGLFITMVATALWIYATLIAYRDLCSNHYDMWLISIALAIFIAIFLTLTTRAIAWLGQGCMGSTDQYFIPEELDQITSRTNKSKTRQRSSTRTIGSKKLSQKSTQPVQPQLNQAGPPPGWANAVGADNQPLRFTLQPVTPGANQVTLPQIGPPPTQAAAVPASATMSSLYKPGAGVDSTHQIQFYPGTKQTPSKSVAGHSTKSPTYHQQTIIPGGGIKPTKKIGSTESTGSTYFQQVMKTKGGVKSISQYGELLKKQRGAGKN